MCIVATTQQDINAPLWRLSEHKLEIPNTIYQLTLFSLNSFVRADPEQFPMLLKLKKIPNAQELVELLQTKKPRQKRSKICGWVSLIPVAFTIMRKITVDVNPAWTTYWKISTTALSTWTLVSPICCQSRMQRKNRMVEENVVRNETKFCGRCLTRSTTEPSRSFIRASRRIAP